MQVVVELYAALRKHADDGEKLVIEVEEGTTIGELVSQLGVSKNTAWNAAVDGQIVYPDDPVTEGSRVIIFPPIAGG